MATPTPHPDQNLAVVSVDLPPLTLPPQRDYSLDTIAVAPELLMTAATEVTTAVHGIVDSLTAINTGLAELQLGWAGDTASKAKEFSDQWNACMTEMFGSKGHTADGVLNRLVDALSGARSNYDGAEDYIINVLFNPFTTLLNAAPPPPPPAGAPPTDPGPGNAPDPAPMNPVKEVFESPAPSA
ncbi:WXG100 family type VII secretion target [Streptomyces sp. RKAG293]|uniref:WXG100 family type VII secretion target n=1 Tax=Streptomyces sp. RKAG293 TaxID=2893403 RepID=UPI0020335CF2|nr:WXG100 family type VII secretion target [Streptomyces sp. RKAG293]MCM2417767.1 WXG100 family type VII secretion target [Streptomyces sp. RKAG293]